MNTAQNKAKQKVNLMITSVGDAKCRFNVAVEDWLKLFSFLTSGHFGKI